MNATKTFREFLDPPERKDELGRLGPYRVMELLGKGGMGEVFRAEDTRLKRDIALKVMTKNFAKTQHSRQRFIDEARSMAAIHHENVVIIFDVGEANETPYMAMEMLKGETLFHWRRSGRQFSEEEILEIGKQLSRGLSAAHKCGIVHRDIKPANIWIEEDTGRVKILDFGLALAGVGVDALSGVGSVIGSPGYLSPEQARDDPLDDRTDLYSVGVILYELCAEELPTHAKSIHEQMIEILAHEPTPLLQHRPQINPALADVIHCLLSKEASDRPDNAEHLEAMLEYASDADAEAIAPVQEEYQPDQPIDQLIDEEDELLPVDDEEELDTLPAAPQSLVQPAKVSKVRSKPSAKKKAGKSPGPKLATSKKTKGRTKGKASSAAKSRKPPSTPKKRSPKTSGRIESGNNRTPRRKKKSIPWPLIVTGVSILMTIGVGIYLLNRDTVIVNKPLPERTKPRTKAQPKKVTLASLKPLAITEVASDSNEVKSGNAIQFSLKISNNAQTAASDPKRINSKATTVAQVSVFAVQPDQQRRLVGSQRMSVRNLPAPTSQTDLSVICASQNLVAGKDCEMIFELQTPDGQVVHSLSKNIKIVE